MKTGVLIAGVGLVLAAVTLGADEGWNIDLLPNIDQGTKELRLNGTLDTDTPLDYDFNLGVAAGVFVMDGLEVGVGANGSGNDLVTRLDAGGFGEYYFDMGYPMVPFVFLGVFYATAEVDDRVYNDAGDADFDSVVGRAGGGVACFLRESVAVELRGIYSAASDDLYITQDGNTEDQNLAMALGLRFYWD